MSVSEDPLDLLIVLVLLLQLLIVEDLFLLTGEQSMQGVTCLGFPDTHIGVLTPSNDISAIHRVKDCIYLLHTFRVVDFSGATIIERENPDCLVEGSCHELTTCWCEIDIKNGLDVIFVNHLRLREVPHIEGITIPVLVAHNEVHGLIGVPSYSTALVLETQSL